MSRRRKRHWSEKYTTPAGVVAANYPLATQALVDYDYVHRLSPADKEWLSDFTNAYYGGDFTNADPQAWPDAAKREVWRDNNTRIRSEVGYRAMVCGLKPVVAPLDPNAPQPDMRPTPEYLNSPTYRAALALYREGLPSHQRQPAKPPPALAEDLLTRIARAAGQPADRSQPQPLRPKRRYRGKKRKARRTRTPTGG